MNCTNCGNIIPEGVPSCPSCGAQIPINMYHNMYQQSAGMYQQPVDMYQQPAGMYQQPADMYQQPADMYQQPTGMYQQQYQMPPKKKMPVAAIVAAIIAVIAIVVVLVVCVFKKDDEDKEKKYYGPQGIYVWDDYAAMGAKIELEIHGDEFTMTTLVSYDLTSWEEEDVVKGSVKVKGNEVTLTYDGEDAVLEYDKKEKTLTMNEDGFIVEFHKK